MEAIGIGVAITVSWAAIIGAFGLSWRNRETIKQRVRELLCSHQWEPIPPDGPAGVSGSEWCGECDARR